MPGPSGIHAPRHFSALRDRLTWLAEADTIRILVATDNHVGFEERDAIRKDDSWRTFDEIINLARLQDVRCRAPPARPS